MMRNAEMFPSLFTSLRSRSCAKPALPSRSCLPGLCVPGCPPASRLTVGQRVQCRQSHLTRSRARRPFGAGPVFTRSRRPASAHPALSAPRPQHRGGRDPVSSILSPRRLCFRHCLRKPSAAPSPSLSGGPVGCEVISPADVDLSLEGGHVTCVLMKGAVRCARATCTGRAVGVIPTPWRRTVGAS